MTIKEFNIPEKFYNDLKSFINTFNEKGFQCYLVGGCVRDLILEHDIYDYDFATDARPEEVMKMFKRVVPTGVKHGTVTVLIHGMEFEVTTFRADGKYIDGRRPEKVHFSDSLEEDVKRRDFTINGLAYDLKENRVIDYVKGMEDLEKGIIRTLGDPMERFSEDGLRTHRACRFASKLDFEIEKSTLEAIGKTLNIAELVSVERVKDELMKLLGTTKPSVGIEYMRETGLLKVVLPELDRCYGVDQNRYHIHDVYYHSLYACDAAPKDKPLIRLSALLHDIGKVKTRREGPGGDYTFYNHEVIGARQVRKILRRLRFSNSDMDTVNNLVINHMFHYTDDWSDGAVRRFMRKVGVENIQELFVLREADRVGNGSRSGLPEPIRILQKRIDRVIEAENAISVRDLDINGNIIMELLGIRPGPVIGTVLNDLLELVLDDPEMNQREILVENAKRIWSEINEEGAGE